MIPSARHDGAPAIHSSNLEDVDALSAAAADGFEIEYVQLEATRFSGRWTVVRLPSMVIQFGREDVAVLRRLRVPADRWAFIVPLHVPAAARWNGQAIEGGELIVCPAGSDGYAFDPAGMQFAIVSVAASSTAGIADRERVAARDLARDVAGGWVRRPPPAEGGVLRRRLADLRAAAERTPEAIARDAPARLPRALLGALVGCLTGEPSDRPGSGAARSLVVRRAEQYFRGHVGQSVSIAQLSAVAGVSERSLRNAFYDVCTTSPKRYLRIWQLHQVRRALRQLAQPPVSVTDVATCHGFFELGRFAGEYKAFFGEAPSETLHKTRVGAARDVA